jgi:hypothetical protein
MPSMFNTISSSGWLVATVTTNGLRHSPIDSGGEKRRSIASRSCAVETVAKQSL